MVKKTLQNYKILENREIVLQKRKVKEKIRRIGNPFERGWSWHGSQLVIFNIKENYFRTKNSDVWDIKTLLI